MYSTFNSLINQCKVAICGLSRVRFDNVESFDVAATMEILLPEFSVDQISGLVLFNLVFTKSSTGWVWFALWRLNRPDPGSNLCFYFKTVSCSFQEKLFGLLCFKRHYKQLEILEKCDLMLLVPKNYGQKTKKKYQRIYSVMLIYIKVPLHLPLKI